jgi:pimeloyl-ACP methyl ester carboxylesterase
VARGYRVVRFDNRDAGLSGRVTGKKRGNLLLAMAASALGLPVRTPYTLADMAGDTIGLMDRLGWSARMSSAPRWAA